MRGQASANAHTFARSLRKEIDSERLLWSRLRMEQLGVKFRRQHPLGRFIADFACLDPKLIVEIDGSQHAHQAAYDAERDALFRRHGFEVLRFPANQSMANIDGVLQVIYNYISGHRTPPSQPSPEGGRSENKTSS